MIGKKLTSVGIFACVYATVYLVGSAIFGAVTVHVGDYQLLRFLLFSAISALLSLILFTVLRICDRTLLMEYRTAVRERTSFLLTHKGFRVELLVALIVFALVALFLAFTSKQLIPRPDIPNTTMALYILLIGYPVFVLLDLCSWAMVCTVFRGKH